MGETIRGIDSENMPKTFKVLPDGGLPVGSTDMELIASVESEVAGTSSTIILPATDVSNYANWTLYVHNKSGGALTAINLYTAHTAALCVAATASDMQSARTTYEKEADTLAENKVGIIFTNSGGPFKFIAVSITAAVATSTDVYLYARK